MVWTDGSEIVCRSGLVIFHSVIQVLFPKPLIIRFCGMAKKKKKRSGLGHFGIVGVRIGERGGKKLKD